MRKRKQIDSLGRFKKTLEEITKPPKSNSKERRLWFRLRKLFDRGLVQVKDLNEALKEYLK